MEEEEEENNRKARKIKEMEGKKKKGVTKNESSTRVKETRGRGTGKQGRSRIR